MKKSNYEDFIMKRAMDILKLTFTPVMGGKMNKSEKKKAIEIAKKAILKGMDNETIRDLTDLTIEEIETIRNIM